MKSPGGDFEFLHIVAKIWQVFASKRLIYDEDIMVECWTGDDRAVTHDPVLRLHHLSPLVACRSVSPRERPFRLPAKGLVNQEMDRR